MIPQDPLQTVQTAGMQIQQLFQELSREITQELSATTPGTPQRQWVELRQNLLQGRAVSQEDIQRAIAAIVNTASTNDNAEIAEFEREEAALERILETRNDQSSFAWYKEDEIHEWNAIYRWASTHITEAMLQQQPELRSAIALLNLRIKSFTDISAREQLRNVTVKEGRNAINTILTAMSQQKVAA